MRCISSTTARVPGGQAFLQRLDLAHGAEEQRAEEFEGRDAGRRLAGGQGFDADRVLVR